MRWASVSSPGMTRAPSSGPARPIVGTAVGVEEGVAVARARSRRGGRSRERRGPGSDGEPFGFDVPAQPAAKNRIVSPVISHRATGVA